MNTTVKQPVSMIHRVGASEPLPVRAHGGASFKLGVLAMLFSAFIAPWAEAKTNLVVNVSADPANVFECFLTAVQMDVTIAGQTVHAIVYRDDAPAAVPPCPCDGIPVPVIKLKVGQTVICHFKNLLPAGTVPEGASVHWHGIELDNESDGTGVTQDALQADQTYNYRFKVTRPGLFWFHSHMTPGNTTFAGMYGAILIPNDIEATLMATNGLPSPQYTYTMAMSDIEYNTDSGSPDYGKVGKLYTVFDTNSTWRTINDLVNICHQNPGPGDTTNNTACSLAGTPGNTVLLNGENPNTLPVTNDVPSGQRIRLHLLNEALSRHFRLKLLDAGSNQITMYRIGGQGGLLNNPRIEGGTQGTRITGYSPGEVAIGSGDRVDVIALLSGNQGDIIQLVGNRLKDKPGPTFPLSNGFPTNYPIAYFRIQGTKGTPDTEPCTCSKILEGTSEEVQKLTGQTNALANPGACPGTNDPVIRLTNAQTTKGQNKVEPAIDLAEGVLEGNTGDGDFLEIPIAKTARYARIGDLLELRVRNETGAVHPFHLHGFSLQPVRILNNSSGATIYTYDYNEFVDTIDVYGAGKNAADENTPGETLVFRVKLEDRERICDDAPSFPPGPVLLPCGDGPAGGAVGRWVFHCHIFSHAGLGMMSELIVLPQPWVQRPELTTNGVDVLASINTGSKTVADDFLAEGNGCIEDIHIWGSWFNDIVDPNTTFELKFWTDVPAGNGKPSRPGWQAWRHLFPPGSYTNSQEGPSIFFERFFDPSQPNIPATDTQVFRYDFFVPPNLAFPQHAGHIYWLSATAYATNGVFGWKTCITNDNWNDDATWSGTVYGPHWTDLHYPLDHFYAGRSMGMAFALNAGAINGVPPPEQLRGVPGFRPVLSLTTSGRLLNISWAGDGILQSADAITGPWADIEDAKNSYLAPMDAPRRFYRLRAP